MSKFISGLELSRAFFLEAIEPILTAYFPGLVYDAALIGTGSEVLGYDDEYSTDHDWRPRSYIFVAPSVDEQMIHKIEKVLRERLSPTFRGYPTTTTISNDPRTHFVHSFSRYTHEYLGIDATVDLQTKDWLILPEQKLLALTSGQVFHSGYGEVQKLRNRLAYYPHDVWLYIMASQWQRISQEEHFMGRTGSVGDELGSHIVATRLVKDIMRLAFLQERCYAPYIKWFGSAFVKLSAASALLPCLQASLKAHSWQEREQYLSQAYTAVARTHNALHLTPPITTAVSSFHNRPFLVIHAGRFATALQSLIQDDFLSQLPLIGSIDQIADNTDILEHSDISVQLQSMYQ